MPPAALSEVTDLATQQAAGVGGEAGACPDGRGWGGVGPSMVKCFPM